MCINHMVEQQHFFSTTFLAHNMHIFWPEYLCLSVMRAVCVRSEVAVPGTRGWVRGHTHSCSALPVVHKFYMKRVCDQALFFSSIAQLQALRGQEILIPHRPQDITTRRPLWLYCDLFGCAWVSKSSPARNPQVTCVKNCGYTRTTDIYCEEVMAIR